MPLRIQTCLVCLLIHLFVVRVSGAGSTSTNYLAEDGGSSKHSESVSNLIQPTWNELMNGSLEGQYIEVRGMIGRVQNRDDGWTVITLHTTRGDLKTYLLRSAIKGASPKDNIRALVRLQGHLMVDRVPETQRVITGQIRLADPQIIIDRPPPSDMFAAPLETAASLTRANPNHEPFRWVKVSGQIIHVRSRLFFMMDSGSGLRFITDDFPDLKAGDLVEVAGYQDVLTAAAPKLLAAVARKTGEAPLPTPKKLSNAELIQPGFDAQWIQVEGVLTEIKPNQKDTILELRTGDLRFWSRLATNYGLLPPLRLGSQLELTGTYCAQGEYKVLGPNVAALDVLLNSPTDVKVISSPSWWTLKRLLVVTGVLFGLLLGTSIWITQLHHQVEQRTAELSVQIQERQKMEHLRSMEQERTRIAQDLHDDLGSEITTVGMLVERAKFSGVSAAQQTRYLDQLSETARAMVATLDEIVWTMNPRHDSLISLVGYLGNFAERFLALGNIKLSLNVPVKMPEIPVASHIRHQLFMVFKEALANVVHHAAATEVRINMTVNSNNLQCEIADNGQGLAPSNPDETANGLANMKERIEKLGGQFEINNGPNAGANLRFEVPLN